MICNAKEGTRLSALVAMAIPACREAERRWPRTGPGRKPEIPDWVMAVLIMVVVAKKKKSKSAQYRYLMEYRTRLMAWLKIKRFPSRTTYFDRYRRAHGLLAGAGYDSNVHGEAVEWNAHGRRTGRRFLCAMQDRGQSQQPATKRRETHVRRAHRLLREDRRTYFRTPRAQQLYARRSTSVEPFNEWFKRLFDIHETVWHYGLDNNRTQILAAIFTYQLLLRYNRQKGKHHGQVQWVLDTL